MVGGGIVGVLSLLLSLGSFSGSGLIGGHAGLDFLNRLFDFGNVLDIFIHQGLVFLFCLMQAVNQCAQLALCLGQAVLLGCQIQLVLALICNIHGCLVSGIHKLHALFFDLIDIQFKHNVTPRYHLAPAGHCATAAQPDRVE